MSKLAGGRPTAPRKVAVVTGDPIGLRLAGPAIRAWSIAAALSNEGHEVLLVSLSGVHVDVDEFEVRLVKPHDESAFARVERWADVIVFQGHALALFRTLRTSQKILVADVYDPMHLEQLEQARGLLLPDWRQAVEDATVTMNQQLARADFLVCASERQRLFYLGQLAALGRVNVDNYRHDPLLKGFIDVVPFGLGEERPSHQRQVMKGVIPGIEEGDRVAIWSGGLYDWFDPLTLIRAVAIAAQREPRLKLFFQGTRHPNPMVPEMAIVAQARDLARELGVLGVSVFLNDHWVEFDDRQNYLTEASVGVSTQHEHIETTFSFRTRILDYLWAGLPMVVSDGDYFADLIRSEGLGRVVPGGDVEALADALLGVTFDDAERATYMENLARVRERFLWRETLRPLVDFVAEPHHAGDWGSAAQRRHMKEASPRRLMVLRRDLVRAAYHLRTGGPRVVAQKVIRRFRP